MNSQHEDTLLIHLNSFILNGT